MFARPRRLLKSLLVTVLVALAAAEFGAAQTLARFDPGPTWSHAATRAGQDARLQRTVLSASSGSSGVRVGRLVLVP